MRRALGKGLAALIGEQSEGQPQELEIKKIVPNARQPRTEFREEALEELAESIRSIGILQPLIVRPISEDKYELIAGERRFRAAQRAGLTSVPVVVRAADQQTSLELALIENIQREDISALECAAAYRRLADEFDLSQDQIAAKVGKSRSAVTNALRLLKLPDEIQEGLRAGKITEGHARALLMADSAILQVQLFRKVSSQGLSVRETERLARAEGQPARASSPAKPAGVKPKPALDPNEQELQDALSTYFGSKVSIQKDAVGGRLSIEFYSDDDLQRILDILGISL
ncbi:MAG TPA: ParB/RepB/Spo0J family partition protein [Fimbriimonadaceae bacterium]|nr:ParB/RepB/Spo0J family partition protein [Fimbriimonadaceae bacterium]HRJ31979.1 ParB/RepB/Spo0J family partition protein [Fimbriimonadaceae bacterium]